MNEERKIETEEVEAVDAPPRARVSETFERKRDYLAGFISGEKEEVPAGGPGGDLQAAVVEVLKSIYDPEIPVDIYELGLIYKVDLDDNRNLTIDMTLTAPGCPVAGEMPGWVENAAMSVEGIQAVTVNMVFDPPWDQSRMSEEAQVALNWW